jgi:hypothetical protein
MKSPLPTHLAGDRHNIAVTVSPTLISIKSKP